MSSFRWIPLAGFLLVAIALAQSTPVPVVDLGYVKYQGTHNSSFDIDAYFGLRYAAPPTGNLRFRAPIAIEQQNNYNNTILDATQVGPQCFQGIPGFEFPPPTSPEPGSEDCLLLDILVPSGVNLSDSRLPVWVQIHGGGYDQSGAESFPGWDLVQQSQGSIIFVGIQYRLNAFGWLGGGEVKGDGTLNAGMLDQRAALEWVQRHIGAFGGDPDKVTVSGNSAGGSSIVNQMAMYGGVPNPPFRAAIIEYPYFQPYHNDSTLEIQYRQILAAANCSDIVCLRSISATALDVASQAALVAGYTISYGLGEFYYGPSVDGVIMPDLPSNALKRGAFSKVPVLVDREGYEGVHFGNMSSTTFPEELAELKALWPFAKPSFFTRLFELYPRSDFNSTFFQWQALFGDSVINCPTYYISTAFSDYDQPVYKLVFDAGSEIHRATVPFLFGSQPQGPDNNATLASVMKDWFTSFVVHGDPNAEKWSNVTDVPHWPLYTGNGQINGLSANDSTDGSFGFSVMDVSYTMIGVVPDPDASAQCDFFHGQSYVVRN